MYPELKLHEKSKTLKSMTLLRAVGILFLGLSISGTGCVGVWMINYYFEKKTCQKWDIEFDDNSWFKFLRGQSNNDIEMQGGGIETYTEEYGDVEPKSLHTKDKISIPDIVWK